MEILCVSFLAQQGAFNLSRLSNIVCQPHLSHLEVDVPISDCTQVSFLFSQPSSIKRRVLIT